MKMKRLIAGVLFCAISLPVLSDVVSNPAAEFTSVHYRYSPYHGHRYGYSKYYNPGYFARKYGYYKPRRYYRHAYPKRRYHSRGYRHRYYR